MSINKVVITGNLGGEPELRTTASGKEVLTFSVAVNDRVPDGNGGWKDKANWVGVVVFGKRAASLANILAKGTKVAIDGKLSYSQWEDNGRKRSKLEVVASDIDICIGKAQESPAPPVQPDADASVYDSDIPF